MLHRRQFITGTLVAGISASLVPDLLSLKGTTGMQNALGDEPEKRLTAETHLIELADPVAGKPARDTAGGSAILAEGQTYPTCGKCRARMVLFFQFDIRSEFKLPFEAGSHLLVFMCPKHNDIPWMPDNQAMTKLAERFWEKESEHYAIILNRPNKKEWIAEPDPILQHRRLTFKRSIEAVQPFGDFDVGGYEFKVGGVPSWINFSFDDKQCPCGCKLQFVCQVSEDFSFPQRPGVPEQPDNFSSTAYGLFLGNFVYIMACSRQCDPRALFAVVDN
jgi:hypothetical protein